jgi:hypothetical protein
MVMYVRKPDPAELVWTSFLTPFSPGIWLSLTVCLLMLSTALLLLDRVWLRGVRQEGLLMHFSRALFTAIKPFCWQGEFLIWVLSCTGASRVHPFTALSILI